MVNRPKNIGTKGERAVVNVLTEYFPEADRRAMQGRFDHGDVINTGIFCFEVKAGEQAKNMKGSREVQEGKLITWFAQTEAERVNAGATYGVLVTQRGGYSEANAGKWWCWVTASTYAAIVGGYYIGRHPIRMELNDFLQMIADQGLTPDVFENAI
jgi:hypothetical protein